MASQPCLASLCSQHLSLLLCWDFLCLAVSWVHHLLQKGTVSDWRARERDGKIEREKKTVPRAMGTFFILSKFTIKVIPISRLNRVFVMKQSVRYD